METVTATDNSHACAVKFGTDGWRGIIAEDFTFANLRVAASAIANYILTQEDPARGVCIGYDTRFGSPSFAQAAAEVVASAGIPVRLASGITPTPALSLAVRGQRFGRRHHDHLQPQSLSVEWSQVQSQLRRLGQAVDDRRHRVAPGQAAGTRFCRRPKLNAWIFFPPTLKASRDLSTWTRSQPAVSSSPSIPCMELAAAFWREFSVASMFPVWRFIANPIRCFLASIRSPSCRIFESCSKWWSNNIARLDLARMATPTALAQWTKTATWSTRTKYSPSCCAG